MKKILISGISGFLGWHLFHFLKNRYRVKGTFYYHRPQVQGGEIVALDIRNEAEVDRSCREWNPDIIIHAAALTSPVECRKKPKLARQINAEGTQYIARAAARSGCRLIYTSTDRVFNGKKGNYREVDSTSPLGQYGKTKLEGELSVNRLNPHSLILRLPLMYGRSSPFHGSFINWMLDAFMTRKPLELFRDQFRSPLYVDDAVRAIDIFLTRRDLSGIYHIGGSERINREAFGFRMAEIFGFSSDCIRSTRMADKADIPPTPVDISLNSDKLFATTGFRARNVSDGLRALKGELKLCRERSD